MTDNDQKMRELLSAVMPDILLLKDMMEEAGVMSIDLLQALYLVINVKKVSKYGEVGFTIRNNEITEVWQRQQLLGSKDIHREIASLMNK